MRLDNKDANTAQESVESKQGTVDSVFEKWKTTGMAILWIAVLIAVIVFIGQMLLWRFAPDLWQSIFGVEPTREMVTEAPVESNDENIVVTIESNMIHSAEDTTESVESETE